MLDYKNDLERHGTIDIFGGEGEVTYDLQHNPFPLVQQPCNHKIIQKYLWVISNLDATKILLQDQ